MKIPVPLLVGASGAIQVPVRPHADAGIPLESFVAYSIEFAYFPAYAGNASHPNVFSNNLMNNIAWFSGSKPHIRVGGSTQDVAQFVESQKEGAILTYVGSRPDQPKNLTFGPAFFESYQTWPGTSFVHGFNFNYNSTSDRQALVASVPYLCKSLYMYNHLAGLEMGNEADLYPVVIPHVPVGLRPLTRPAAWKEPDYVAQWLNYTRDIDAAIRSHCPDISISPKAWVAPSFANAANISGLDPVLALKAGLDTDKNLKVFGAHQ
jgi:hypothetical protein